MEIRKVENDELKEALELVWEVFKEFEAPEYCREGIEEFRNFLNNKTEIEKLVMYGAFQNKMVIGVLAMRSDHISLFFVNKEYHRKGVGKTLFNYMKEHSDKNRFTVNSSPYAVKIYKKLGFIPRDIEQITNGIRYTPMIYEN